ncbi:ABC transporter permease [Clostridium botulinum]|uniref:ABC transporter permease n=1 Tax=Clostridium botulinum TaxID=1491 RepID=A0A6G4HXQ3_CLOBO|nr:ABC transporter permease [Clostridium botulinum]MBD5589616.1 ABC transporter permease [Clostridium botulinum]MBO0572426.1 ABC transporter permease [Clostridium botulinum]MBO0582275.1 ABC transporter permease [Clostridium botulinum]NFI47799.1 ABC transporter permease [Clostridium botulinum]NFJ69672.1 ABC transporter permease [Clostridium botulinum]
MNSLLKIKYSIKTKNKFLIFSIGLYYITCIFLILFAELWEFVKMTTVLIPIVLCTNVLSEEYDNNREGMIIPNGTPLYKIVFSRYFVNFFISQLMIASLFFIALLNKDNKVLFLRDFIIVSVYSLFLAFVGLLVSNITKDTIHGYSVAIGYFIFQLVAGNFIFGKYCPILASSFNLSLKDHTIISNLYFMMGISIILFFINLLYICGEKKIKKTMLKIAALSVSIFIIVIFANKYVEHNKFVLANKVLNNNEKVVYIIDSNDKNLVSYCKNKNINFSTENKLTLEKYKDKNIIVISKYNSSLANDVKNILNFKINLDKRDLMIGDNGIYNSNSFRILFNNPLNKENKILFIQSRLFNSKDLDILLNEKYGGFVAVKDGLVVANAKYDTENINMENFFKNVNIVDNNGWLIKKNTKTQLLYRDLEEKDVDYLFSKWNKIKNIIDRDFNNADSNKQYQVYFRENITNLQKNFIPLKVEILLDLEEKRGYKIDDSFSKGYLEEKGLEFVSDKRLKDGWLEFINQTIIYPELYNDNEYKSDYIKMIEEKTKEVNSYSQEDDQYFSGKILSSIKGKNKRIDFINEIMNCNSKISNSEIEKIYSKYVGVETAKNNMRYFK